MIKAQADIISAVIIVLIAIGLTSSALLWGLPLIQKRQDMALVSRVNNLFTRDLPLKIKNVANMGGSDFFSVDANGIWILDENKNTLTFTFFSKASDKAVGVWIGEECSSSEGFVYKNGTLGVSEPCIVCARADQMANGYNITYQLGCREVWGETKGYKLKLKPVGVTISKSKMIKISKGSVSGDNLITTEIEILL